MNIMSENRAGGRKTQHRDESRTELQIDSQIEALSAHVAHALTQAKAIPADTDPYGHARSAEIDTAVKLANTTAKLATALAKLKGEFRSEINVRHHKPQPLIGERGDDVEARRARERAEIGPIPDEPPLITPEEWAADSVDNAELWRRAEERQKQRAGSAG
jgi:hypothetical protein